MAFAILRTAKIKTAGNAGALSDHLERTMNTPNADPDLKHLNRRVIGTGDLKADIAERIGALNITPRKNAVLGVEFLMTASPEAFAYQVRQEEGKKELYGDVQKWKTFEQNARQWLEK